MSLSHWGIFPGFYIPLSFFEPTHMLTLGESVATWHAVPFDDWCALCG